MEQVANFFKSFPSFSGVWGVLLAIFVIYFLLIIILNVFCSFSQAKPQRGGSSFVEKFKSTNSELWDYLTESEKELMRQTLNNTLINQNIADINDDDLKTSPVKIKKNKSVKIEEDNNSYHYINVKSEII